MEEQENGENKKRYLKGILIAQKEPGQDDEDFGAMVCMEYYLLVEDFILEEGKYNFVMQLLDKAFEMGIADRISIAAKIDQLTSDAINKIIDMSLQRDELPVPNNDYILALYERFQQSDKSYEAVKQITDDFVSVIDEVLETVDYYYNGNKIDTLLK